MGHRFFASSTTSGVHSSDAAAAAAAVKNPPPVVIVGGGPVGLFLSHLLRHLFGIPHILLEARDAANDCFRHPQAHFLNTRTMELFRHCLPPTVSSQLMQAMPPVRQWQHFSFGSSVAADQVRPLAVVRHPVHRPLQVATDANGILLPLSSSSSSQEDGGNDPHNPLSLVPSWSDLSPCSVGHLAQHTFGRILYDYATTSNATISTHMDIKHEETNISEIRYGARVERIHIPRPCSNATTTNDTTAAATNLIQVATADGTVYETDWLVAADGAHSTVRSQLPELAEKEGCPDPLQHLMNLHVTLPPDVAAETLHRNNNNNHAMLYSVYSEHVVAMVVCHSVGEYVVQIPFFPPYQTPESDFGPAQWPTLLQAIFGPRAAPHCRIVSVRPWTMTSWVARRYGWVSHTNNNNNTTTTTNAAVVLVGDAAHVFPPAGGFGMNTGLQDAHNLACKIATHRYRSRPHNNSDPSTDHCWLHSLVSAYEQERQPIARQNAALSLRNYQRLLRVTQQLNLNDRHPALLQSVLDRSPLPLAIRQATFRSLLQTALYPLRWLKDNNDESHHYHYSYYYRNHIQSNLRRILQSGAGLPLLFPKFEIGYTYDCMKQRTLLLCEPPPESPDLPELNDWSADTWAAPPRLRVGGLVPHVAVHVVGTPRLFPQLRPLPNNEHHTTTWISTTDLPAQMARSTAPCYVLLWVVLTNVDDDNQSSSNAQDLAAAESLARERAQGLPVEVAVLWPRSNDDRVDSSTRTIPPTFFPVSATLSEFLYLVEPPRPEPAFSWARWRPGKSYGVVVRPDGHIEELITMSTRNKDEASETKNRGLMQ